MTFGMKDFVREAREQIDMVAPGDAGGPEGWRKVGKPVEA